jgi:hypothetical protein
MQDVEKNYVEVKTFSEQEFNWLSLSVHTYVKAAIIAAAVLPFVSYSALFNRAIAG